MSNWQFIDDRGTFRLTNPHHINHLYFPLVNETGFTSVVTPLLHGDVKADHHSYLTPPVSVEDLHNSRGARNFWVQVAGHRPWSATGNSAWQMARRFSPAEAPLTLTAGLLWHQVQRENRDLGLRATITSFVPAGRDRVELMRVTLTNSGEDAVTLAATAAVPMYARSADNLRDHRHVTALLHRIHTVAHGVLVKPTLSFDERGHAPNKLTYAVLGADGAGRPPAAFWPLLADFIGAGGSLDWPQAVAAPTGDGVPAGQALAGYEALGGLRFPPVTLAPGASQEYILLLAILREGEAADDLVARYARADQFAAELKRTTRYWDEKLDALQVHTGSARYDGWLRWVAIQPILRRLCGNSYLPYHDYGRGGRGWRDLWQDLLALLITEPDGVRRQLLGHFAGVRLDGSNATIIGAKPGEFKADRNNIPRVWMDHGAWPLLTTQLYLDTSGDLDFLLQEQAYFRDQWTHRAQVMDPGWQPEAGTQHQTAAGMPYRGTVLEHLLVQHLTAFFNVGEHNIIRLEGADWNDGLDMAPNRGESVAFTALYAANLRQLSRLVRQLAAAGHRVLPLAAELTPLLDSLSRPVDYGDLAAKQQRLAAYFATVAGSLSGERVAVAADDLAADLAGKATWLIDHLRRQEWIEAGEGLGWYNGYYDEEGARLEGVDGERPRMTLTAQTFTILGDVATDNQVEQMVQAADRYLLDETVGGYRLNTDFGRVMLTLGRMFGFAYGHKENGAMFSHMAVMYANALYRRGRPAAGFAVLDGIFQHLQAFATSQCYPGIPEYIDDRGRGAYPYLTGSASWYLMTVLIEMFGVRGDAGDLCLQPRLLARQFDADGRIGLTTRFAGRRLRISFHNPHRLEAGAYRIARVTLNGDPVPVDAGPVHIPRARLADLAPGEEHRLEVTLLAI